MKETAKAVPTIGFGEVVPVLDDNTLETLRARIQAAGGLEEVSYDFFFKCRPLRELTSKRVTIPTSRT